MQFRADQIDHVELSVPDRFEAAEWYQRVLGLEIVPEYRFWSDHPRGPLMIGTHSAGTKLALFQNDSANPTRNEAFRVAFRVDGDRFLDFLTLLDSLGLKDERGKVVTKADTVDHTCAFSIYFSDPWDHALEITTYDHATVRHRISSQDA